MNFKQMDDIAEHGLGFISCGLVIWPSYRPHNASCTLSVCPVQARNLKKNIVEKSNIPNFPGLGRVSGVPLFSSKGERSRSPNVKTLKKLLHILPAEGRWQLRRRLQTSPNLLLGIIYCRRSRRSATGWTAAYHVGTRRQHLFFLHHCFFWYSVAV